MVLNRHTTPLERWSAKLTVRHTIRVDSQDQEVVLGTADFPLSLMFTKQAGMHKWAVLKTLNGEPVGKQRDTARSTQLIFKREAGVHITLAS